MILKRIIKDSINLLKYATPNLFQPSVKISDKANHHLDELRTLGVTKLNTPELDEVARYLESDYFPKIPRKQNHSIEFLYNDGQTRLFVQQKFEKEIYLKGGSTLLAKISPRDNVLKSILLNPDLIGIVYNYLGRQPYLRNSPYIQEVIYQGKDMLDNGKFHVDHLHQVLFMLLTTDVTLENTHMEYLLGSNNRPLIREGISISPSEVEHLLPKYPKIFNCIGPKGTLFIFDSTGIHRANYKQGGLRRMLHLNYTTGHNFDSEIDILPLDSWVNSFNIPKYVKDSFRVKENLNQISLN